LIEITRSFWKETVRRQLNRP